jgi:hypothetical protein
MPYTLAQLEAFVSSPAYDAQTAGLIARGIPALKAAGAPGELLSPGVRRIHGNLCNVHGRYGPCDKALSGKLKPKKGRAPAKPRQTPAQRVQARQQQHDQNAANVAKQMADNDTGLSPSGATAMTAFAKGTQPDAATGAGLAKMGLAERASDGSYRMTPTGHAVVAAMAAGDYQRAVDAVSRGTDSAGKRTERQTAAQARRSAAAKRQQDAAGKRAANQIGHALTQRPTKPPAKASAGGSKKPAPAEKPLRAAMPPRRAASSIPQAAALAPNKPPKPVAPPKAPAKQIAPALQTAADQLSQGTALSDDDTQALIRNGLAKLNTDGLLVLTAAGMRATTKDEGRRTELLTLNSQPSTFKIFKDTAGRDRWVAQSSTAFQDRDREIVSTKALADDCAWADRHDNAYGPLRWWHTPGLDLGDCDFNAMHGRVLIESGTFRSPQIAQKVAQASAGLEISLGFLHLPSEPDADGVFHHIRRFERSLVPRGKASNRFTAFTVKETRMSFDPTKVAALKTLGFSDDDITALQSQAAATEKSATDQGVAFKADEPECPDVVLNGITYKAFPPKAADAPAEGTPEEEAAESPEEEQTEMDAGEGDAGGLTLSPEDLDAIGQSIGAVLSQALAPLMGLLDMEKKMQGHVQTMMAPYQATKDAESAQTKEQLTTLAAQVAELTGDQPAAPYRASAAKDSILNTQLLDAMKSIDPNAGPFDDVIKGLGLARPQ